MGYAIIKQRLHRKGTIDTQVSLKLLCEVCHFLRVAHSHIEMTPFKLTLDPIPPDFDILPYMKIFPLEPGDHGFSACQETVLGSSAQGPIFLLKFLCLSPRTFANAVQVYDNSWQLSLHKKPTNSDLDDFIFKMNQAYQCWGASGDTIVQDNRVSQGEDLDTSL